MFKLNKLEEEVQSIYVVYLDKKCAVIKVKDFAPDSSCKCLLITEF